MKISCRYCRKLFETKLGQLIHQTKCDLKTKAPHKTFDCKNCGKVLKAKGFLDNHSKTCDKSMLRFANRRSNGQNNIQNEVANKENFKNKVSHILPKKPFIEIILGNKEDNLSVNSKTEIKHANITHKEKGSLYKCSFRGCNNAFHVPRLL